jgi:hypothetical protein
MIWVGVRVVLVALLVIGGLVFHHRGHGYEAVRAVYVVALIGFLGWRISSRQRRGQSRRDRGPGPF